MEDAYVFMKSRLRDYASLISHCKQNAMRCQICKISCKENLHLKCVKIKICGLVTLNKSNSDLRHGR